MTERLTKLSSYFNEKERSRLDEITRSNHGGLPEMSPDEIRLSCLENNGYELPELNDKLYLHFRGFKKIENLTPYKACKAIWLDSNGFHDMNGLECLEELRCLYLSKNLIKSITGLDNLQFLNLIDLSNNQLTHIEGLSCLPHLQTVNVSRNSLSTGESIKHFQECKSLQILDLANNFLPPDESILDIICDFHSAVTLNIAGNEICKLPHFRKRAITRMKKLGYLDRPIEPQERLGAEAFVSGGVQAETKVRDAWREEQKNKRLAETAEFKSWQIRQREENKEAIRAGKNFLPDFTPEQLERRRIEADKAAQDEKDALKLGVGRLANKYYSLEGQGNTGDVLGQAASQILEENANKIKLHAKAHEISQESEIDYNSIEIVEDDDKDDDKINAKLEAMDIKEDEIIEPEVVEIIDHEAVARQREEDRIQKEKEKQEEAEQYVRDQRVAESMYLYKKQLAAEKAGTAKKDSTGNFTVVPKITSEEIAEDISRLTWENSIKASKRDPSIPRPLYWTESMDMKLATLVRDCVFDFDEIALRMSTLIEDNILGEQAKESFSSGTINKETCRLRWAELDASQWAVIPEQSTALDTVFKICIGSSVLGSGHGAQPNFQALASMTAGSTPSYLTPPSIFPSVSDIEDPSDDENEEVFVCSNNQTNVDISSIDIDLD